MSREPKDDLEDPRALDGPTAELWMFLGSLCLLGLPAYFVLYFGALPLVLAFVTQPCTSASLTLSWGLACGVPCGLGGIAGFFARTSRDIALAPLLLVAGFSLGALFGSLDLRWILLLLAVLTGALPLWILGGWLGWLLRRRLR